MMTLNKLLQVSIGLLIISVGVLYGDVSRTGQDNPWRKLSHNDREPQNIENNSTLQNKVTTPWPSLGQRGRNNDNRNGYSTSSTNSPRQWIQRNNIWIRNNQANSSLTGAKQTGINSDDVKKMTLQNPDGHMKQEQGENVDEVEQSNLAVTDDELRDFSERLLAKDSNNAMKYVTVNLQGTTTSRSTRDEAPLPLLKIDEKAYKIPSIEAMVPLYNNYFLDAAQNEVYTGQERIEENAFLDAILGTPVMQYTRNFLMEKGKVGRDPKDYRDLLRQIWFYMYSRGSGRIGSSGFEHVFLAEIKNSQVSGLHNWVFFSAEESQGKANYLGYMKKLDLGEQGAILKYHFTFHDIDKPVGSMFIGTSLELEFAVYTACFVLRADKICPLKMNGNRFIVRAYTFRYRGKNMIGSVFPEI